MSTNAERDRRLNQLIAKHEPAEYPEDIGGRWALVEQGNSFDHTIIITLHDSPAEASEYWAGQECPQEWDPVELVDLETGEGLEPEVSYVVTFAPRVGAPLAPRVGAAITETLGIGHVLTEGHIYGTGCDCPRTAPIGVAEKGPGKCDICGDEGGKRGELCGRDFSEELNLAREGAVTCPGRYQAAP